MAVIKADQTPASVSTFSMADIEKQAKLVPMVSGVLLCVYPYAFDSVLWLIVIGIALIAAPFLIDG